MAVVDRIGRSNFNVRGMFFLPLTGWSFTLLNEDMMMMVIMIVMMMVVVMVGFPLLSALPVSCVTYDHFQCLSIPADPAQS